VRGRDRRAIKSRERQPVNRAALALIAAVLAAAPVVGAAQTLSRCNIGEQVTDTEGRTGIIVDAEGEVCRLRYADGQIRGWAAWSLRPADAAPPPAAGPQDSIVLRGYAERRRLVYRADARDHFTIAATANGAAVRFLVDTGATLVFLTMRDAEAAGIDPGALAFDQTASTSNGQVRIALVVLRDIQIDDLSVERVPAAVVASAGQSVLGMSFLSRLKNFAISNGTLTIEW
jgi:clan AA aspartic protease (TIGR02281 family)